MQIHADDPRLKFWAPQPAVARRGAVRAERFTAEANQILANQIGPLANVRSSSGCAVLIRCNSPWIELQLERLRHHQFAPVGIDCEVISDDGSISVTHSADLRDRDGDCTIRFSTGLEREGTPATCCLWLPLISTCAVAGMQLAEGSAVETAVLPKPRWLAIGDSLTQGFSVQQPTQHWVHRCARAWQLPVWNLGVGGLRIEPELFATALQQQPWELVTVGLGSNHAWRDGDAAQTAERATALCDQLMQAEIKHIVWLMPPWKPLEDGKGPPEFFGVPLDQAAARRLAGIRDALQTVIARYPTITLVADLTAHEHRFYADGLHPAATGFAKMADALQQRLTETIGLAVSG